MSNEHPSQSALLVEAHRKLLDGLQSLEEAAGTTGQDTAGVVGHLGALKELLAEHFHSEEQGGYLQAVLARAPHLERKVRALGDEHGEISRSLDALRTRLQEVQPTDDSFRQQVLAWVALVRRHEAAENLLVEDVYNCEPCAED